VSWPCAPRPSIESYSYKSCMCVGAVRWVLRGELDVSAALDMTSLGVTGCCALGVTWRAHS
jgi:hypothetical protein